VQLKIYIYLEKKVSLWQFRNISDVMAVSVEPFQNFSRENWLYFRKEYHFGYTCSFLLLL